MRISKLPYLIIAVFILPAFIYAGGDEKGHNPTPIPTPTLTPTPTVTPTPTPLPGCSLTRPLCPGRKSGTADWGKPTEFCWSGTPFCPGEIIWSGGNNLNKISWFCFGADECIPCPGDSFTIIDVDPAQVPANQMGSLNIVIAVETTCCGIDDPIITIFTVTAQVGNAPCGNCNPNNVDWICDRFTPAATGGVFCGDNTSKIFYANDHDFDFTLGGISQGSGKTGTEEIIKRITLSLITEFGETAYYAQYYDGSPTNPYIKSAPLSCVTDCNNRVNRATISDLYRFGTTPLMDMLLCDYERKDYPPSGVIAEKKATFTAKHEWIDQKIYVNYGTSDQILLKTFPTKSVTISKPVTYGGTWNSTSCNLTVDYGTCTKTSTGSL